MSATSFHFSIGIVIAVMVCVEPEGLFTAGDHDAQESLHRHRMTAHPVSVKVMTIAMPVLAVVVSHLMPVVHTVKLNSEVSKLNALGLGGVLLCLLDFVDHPGIDHPTLLWGSGNALGFG